MSTTGARGERAADVPIWFASPLIRALRNPAVLGDLNHSEWSLLLRQANGAGLLARLHTQALRLGIDSGFPASVHRQMNAAQVAVARQTVAVLWEVKQIAAALESLDVPVLLLKGAAYAAADLPAAVGRTFSDIDILVPKAMIGPVEHALVVAGWVGSALDAYDQHYYRRWMHELPPMLHIRRRTPLDVHHNILPETARIKTQPQRLFDAAVRLPGYDNVYMPSPVDQVLHSATHLFHEGEWQHGLRDLSDLDLLLRAYLGTDGFAQHLSARAGDESAPAVAVGVALCTARAAHTGADGPCSGFVQRPWSLAGRLHVHQWSGKRTSQPAYTLDRRSARRALRSQPLAAHATAPAVASLGPQGLGTTGNRYDFRHSFVSRGENAVETLFSTAQVVRRPPPRVANESREFVAKRGVFFGSNKHASTSLPVESHQLIDSMNAEQLPPHNRARRRLTRGGIAMPVVLASVISRNAFAAVPYQCTVSGKLSGNVSLFGPNKDASDTCTMRAGRSDLMSALQSDKTSFASVFEQTFYADGDNTSATKLAGDPFKQAGKDTAIVGKPAAIKVDPNEGTSGKPPQDATLYQVLKLDHYIAGAKPKDPEFARMAIVAYRNATAGPSDLYPLTKQQVVAMFKAAVVGRDYEGSTTMGPFKWSPGDVRKYFEHLYH